MKFILVLCSLFIAANVFAQSESPKHMVMFGNTFSAGWSGSASTADVDSGLGIEDYEVTNGNFKINYAYSVLPQLQIGLDYESEMTTTEVKAEAGGKVKSEERSASLMAFVIFNFTENLYDSFYLGAGIGKEWNEDETKDSTGGSTTKTESEWDANTLFATFGKRFNLKGIGIQNLTYSPSITYIRGEVNGDLEDEGVNSLSQFRIDLVKFDLLF